MENQAQNAAGTKVMMCTCNHASQDAMYGKGMRVFNACGTKRDTRYRCTVCGKERK